MLWDLRSAPLSVRSTVHRSFKIYFHRSQLPVNQSNPKLVLFWTNFFYAPDPRATTGGELFRGCPYSSCAAISDRSKLNQSSALIFHMVDFNRLDIPKTRQSFQKYVFFLGEPPVQTAHLKWNEPEGFFNWTFTYRRDSDILGVYTYNATLIPKGRDMAAGKTKQAAWFVSHCNVGPRNDYVRDLQKYMQVDVYGACGPLKCPYKKVGEFGDFSPADPCLQMIEKDYRFYLAFENRYKPNMWRTTRARTDCALKANLSAMGRGISVWGWLDSNYTLLNVNR